MAKQRKATWIEISVMHVGMRGTSTALKWAYQWGYVQEALGYDPTVEEVAKWWRVPRRTAFRDQAIFREAYPKLETPAWFFMNDEARDIIKARLLADPDHTQLEPSDTDILEIGLLDATLPPPEEAEADPQPA